MAGVKEKVQESVSEDWLYECFIYCKERSA